MIKKEELEDKNKHKNNEKLLFHGTGPDKTDQINHHGFNRSFAGMNGISQIQYALLKIKALKRFFTEEPFLVPQRTIQSFLPFYNLKNLLSPQQTFCETERFFRC